MRNNLGATVVATLVLLGLAAVIVLPLSVALVMLTPLALLEVFAGVVAVSTVSLLLGVVSRC